MGNVMPPNRALQPKCSPGESELFETIRGEHVGCATRLRDVVDESAIGMTVRVALANVRVPATPPESVLLATSAVAEAGRQGAVVICFPECLVPGYRWPGTKLLPPDPAFLDQHVP